MLPIQVDKMKGCRSVKKNFIDNCGLPDVPDEYDMFLHNINGGAVLCKLKHPPPDFNRPPNPSFLSP
jgi:hypothetical protein